MVWSDDDKAKTRMWLVPAEALGREFQGLARS